MNSDKSLLPTDAILKFLEELPSPMRELVLLQLYIFFSVELEMFSYAEPEELLGLIVHPMSEYENFFRAILLMSALDYIFSRNFAALQVSSRIPKGLKAVIEKALGKSFEELATATVSIPEDQHAPVRAQWTKLRASFSLPVLHEAERMFTATRDEDEPLH